MKMVEFSGVHPIRWGQILQWPTKGAVAGCSRKIYPFLKVTATIGLSLTAMLMMTNHGQAVDRLAESLESSVPKSKPIALFNGKDLTGWQQVGDAHWEVREGLLLGRQGPGGTAGDLLTKATYDDFHLLVIYKVQWPANTGIWYRYQSPSQAYQADILEYKNPIAYSGSLYCPGKMFLAINKDPNRVHREGWNRLVIRVEDDRHILHLNGKQVADIHDNASTHGKIGIQVHAGDQFHGMQVTIKQIALRPL